MIDIEICFPKNFHKEKLKEILINRIVRLVKASGHRKKKQDVPAVITWYNNIEYPQDRAVLRVRMDRDDPFLAWVDNALVSFQGFIVSKTNLKVDLELVNIKSELRPATKRIRAQAAE